MELTNAPVPAPSLVQLPPNTGLAVVAQPPLAETAAPPSAVALPPEVAPEEVIPVMAAVVTVGSANVVNWTSAPYPVPDVLVAKALT